MTGLWTDVDRLDDPDSAYAQEAVKSASYIMWVLSGRRYGGVRNSTDTYCQSPEGGYLSSELPTARLAQGEVVNTCGSCGGGCGHTLKLRGTPIVNVTEVRINDSIIDLATVDIVDRSRIAPSSGCWGSCDDITVTYTYGAVPPVAGVHAATALANQFLWAMTEDDRCTLPERVTSISRQGVSWTLLDDQDFLQQGRTGIYSVDLFLKTVNPDNARLRPRVFSPDVPRGRTRRPATTTITTATRPPSAP